jgi:hypothetical protein
MNSTGKTANLRLLFLLVFALTLPLRAEPLPGDDETQPLSDEPLLSSLESLLMERANISGNEDFIDGSEEPVSGNEGFTLNEDTFIIDRLSQDDDDLDEDYFFSEEFLLFEAPALVYEASQIFAPRSFNEIFPGFSRNQRIGVMTNTGLRYAFEKDGTPSLIPHPDSGIDLLSIVMAKKPSHIIEALVIVPYTKRQLDMLDVYNSLREIRRIKDYTIPSGSNQINIFKDTTRLDNAQSRKPISDPPPVNTLPYAETVYLCFTDQYMGALYLKGDISVSLYGITYSMTNFRDVSYSIFRIMKAERFSAIIYLEPIKEGILVYSMSGLYIPGFIANRVNLTPNMNARIRVLVNWITDGLRKEENNPQGSHFFQMMKN